METEPCVRCGRAVKVARGINSTADPSVVIYLLGATAGVRPRIRSKYQRRVLHSGCAASIALGPPPENGEFNTAIYYILREIASADKTLVEAAWVQMTTPNAKPRLMPGSKPDTTLAGPALKSPALMAAS